jgi:hypothetical protein
LRIDLSRLSGVGSNVRDAGRWPAFQNSLHGATNIGENSATADLEALADAKRRIEAGANPDAVWSATRWNRTAAEIAARTEGSG